MAGQEDPLQPVSGGTEGPAVRGPGISGLQTPGKVSGFGELWGLVRLSGGTTYRACL